MQKQQLRILTYNLHKGFNTGNRQFILHEMREALVQTDADIMLLQEIQGEHTGHQQTQMHWPDCCHSEFLAKDVWPHVAYAKNAVYNVGHHGNAILSKFPLIQWENINVSPFSWASRSLLHGVIEMPGSDQQLHIICIHLGLLGIERRRQFVTLCERIGSHVPDNAPLIVAGDFNDWSGQAEKHFARRLDLREAYRALHNRHARTWPAWLPVLKMDRIYYRGLEATLCERPPRSAWTNLSDHAPLIAAFEI
ncbi:endonuclease/exonuclease/phosphatase family protein [Methylophaga lonarensis MPL]|uniref:Endonuclease/exonuclease/phosphatase family protein n=1 Tax=Methylophaga lonarensis MPL TaxID=1286106 RepID=M7P2Y1_9GAMM|nr:endonuclease/exonuclease/phosphatase family protein [Methylophaga lonarensis]EMR13847.1 endonuclease/exonuclease/phosphatase family protein [Methylophaga lonarensis MPL]